MTHPDDNLIAWLGGDGSASGGSGSDRAAALDASTLGGKGASLDRLGRLGFRVPPGFCLTIAAFRAQPREAPFNPRVGEALDRAVERLVADVAPAGFEPRFAVRSSAVGEDGSVASYAGLHETELDVTPDGVGDAVQRCWASLWSPAAVAYRERRNLPADDAAMAVVVQALVPADAAAVVFTRHPVTGRDDQVVVTAVRGLGDAMVSGTVTPDTFVVDKASRGVLAFERGEGPDGPALDATVLAALVDLSLDVEARFGQAVDIEAAITGDTWYLLQARPITTAAPVGAR